MCGAAAPSGPLVVPGATRGRSSVRSRKAQCDRGSHPRFPDDEALLEPREVVGDPLPRARVAVENLEASLGFGDELTDPPTGDTGETFRLSQREARAAARAPRGARVHVEFHPGTGRTT